MSDAYPTLFSLIKLRHKVLKNRIVLGPHSVNMSHEGLSGDRHFGYYRERARGNDKIEILRHLEDQGLIDYVSCRTSSYLHQLFKIVPSFQFDMKLDMSDAALYKKARKTALTV